MDKKLPQYQVLVEVLRKHRDAKPVIRLIVFERDRDADSRWVNDIAEIDVEDLTKGITKEVRRLCRAISVLQDGDFDFVDAIPNPRLTNKVSIITSIAQVKMSKLLVDELQDA